MPKILIVEDDENIAMLEKDYLVSNGFEADILNRGDEVISCLETRKYDLVLLDIMLPGISGYDICRQIRDKIDIPILMVTARTESIDVIRGLGLGADDYIVKPFDPSQLVARVRAHLNQYERLKRNNKENEKVKINNIEIEPLNWKVYKGEKEVKLTNREFELLLFLAQNPNIVFTREELFEKIWGYDYVSDAATVSVHINRLRIKLEEDPKDPKMIETIWGAGYRMNIKKWGSNS